MRHKGWGWAQGPQEQGAWRSGGKSTERGEGCKQTVRWHVPDKNLSGISPFCNSTVFRTMIMATGSTCGRLRHPQLYVLGGSGCYPQPPLPVLLTDHGEDVADVASRVLAVCAGVVGLPGGVLGERGRNRVRTTVNTRSKIIDDKSDLGVDAPLQTVPNASVPPITKWGP